MYLHMPPNYPKFRNFLSFPALLVLVLPLLLTAADRSLKISDGSYFVPKDFYPEFSWETTPRYFMFGDKNRLLRPE